MATRIENYSLGVQPLRVTEFLTANKTGMSGRVGLWFQHQFKLWYATLAVCGMVTPAILIPQVSRYFAAVLEYDKFYRGKGLGEPGKEQAAMIVAKWVARGLDEANLIKVLSRVCGVEVPATPPA